MVNALGIHCIVLGNQEKWSDFLSGALRREKIGWRGRTKARRFSRNERPFADKLLDEVESWFGGYETTELRKVFANLAKQHPGRARQKS